MGSVGARKCDQLDKRVREDSLVPVLHSCKDNRLLSIIDYKD